MRTLTVSFFGHRHMKTPLQTEQNLEKIISHLLQENDFIEFLVGRNGEFDQIVSSTIRKCKRQIRNDNSVLIWIMPYSSVLIWIMPYSTAEYRNNKRSFLAYYDEIEICEQAAAAHYKAAFQIRNRAMVDRSDLVILYIDHSYGGAYQTFQYVKKIGKKHINIAEGDDSFSQLYHFPFYTIP